MKKEPSVSILEAKEIEKFIVDKFKPIKLLTTVFSREEVDIYIETKSSKSGFEVITPITLKKDDILQFAKEILKTKKINAQKLSLNIVHADGDSREMLDYGTDEFAGVKFQWPQDNISL